jgi:dihydrolipoamide dehydrogenase
VTGEGEPRRLSTAAYPDRHRQQVRSLPGIPFDGRRIVHRTDALTLPEVPARLLVIGAGAIGLELGSVWHRLGSDVTVLEYLDRIVAGRRRYRPAAAPLARAAGAQVPLRHVRAGRERGGERSAGRGAPAAGGEVSVETADVLLVAVGRRPFTDGLGRGKWACASTRAAASRSISTSRRRCRACSPSAM